MVPHAIYTCLTDLLIIISIFQSKSGTKWLFAIYFYFRFLSFLIMFSWMSAWPACGFRSDWLYFLAFIVHCKYCNFCTHTSFALNSKMLTNEKRLQDIWNTWSNACVFIYAVFLLVYKQQTSVAKALLLVCEWVRVVGINGLCTIAVLVELLWCGCGTDSAFGYMRMVGRGVIKMHTTW